MQQCAHDAFRNNSNDIVLLSPTGSGKTLAYLVPLAESVRTEVAAVQAVVIVPSRELAQQSSLVLASMKTEVRGMALYGGRPTMDEHRKLNALRPHILFATPGRLVDHLQKGNFLTDQIHTLVIDEFDKCLELGFQAEMQESIGMMPAVERRFLLSATDAEAIPRFVRMQDACRLDFLASSPLTGPSDHSGSEEKNLSARLEFHVVHSPMKDKLNTLSDLLRTLGNVQAIVFLNYREAVERCFHFLQKEGFACAMYHGGMEQERRERALYKFSNLSCNILVSTDLGSRGLDLPDTDVIIHYHLPMNEEAFTHRNGRTARWLSNGRSFMILNDEETLPEYIDERSASEFYLPKSLPPITRPRMCTIYIGKGKKEKLSKMDILGFLCKQGGLQREDVGRIDVREHYSYAAVSLDVVASVLQRIEGQKIKGIKTLFKLS